ncbi:Uncharacterized protein FWK35_00008326 [Aphis craccivora]|uniref:Uncharacterized protein n=1 Tax=Aphis craccivora TaxID=307492 RepID=A0A6G0ZJ34_APHCR|nr:Uncharacterized protein FWK35_00008326 [Aphis craccivora]
MLSANDNDLLYDFNKSRGYLKILPVIKIRFLIIQILSNIIRNNTPISNFGGGFRYKNIIEVKSKHFLTVFKTIEKNKKKMTDKL